MQRAWTRLLQPHWSAGPAGPGSAGGNTLAVGQYTLEVPAGVTINRLQNGVVELDAPGQGKAHIAPQSGLTPGAGVPSLGTAAQRWNQQYPLQFLTPAAASRLDHLAGSAAYGLYQQNLVDQRGPNVVHGVFYLHVGEDGEGVVIDVFDNGLASESDWKPLTAFLTQILGKLGARPR